MIRSPEESVIALFLEMYIITTTPNNLMLNLNLNLHHSHSMQPNPNPLLNLKSLLYNNHNRWQPVLRSFLQEVEKILLWPIYCGFSLGGWGFTGSTLAILALEYSGYSQEPSVALVGLSTYF